MQLIRRLFRRSTPVTVGTPAQRSPKELSAKEQRQVSGGSPQRTWKSPTI